MENTHGGGFWIGEILLSVLEDETGFNGSHMAYTFELRGKTYTASTLADLSLQYGLARNASHEGNSTFPKSTVFEGGKIVGVFSYNGRIWNGDNLVYDNREESPADADYRAIAGRNL